MRITMKNSMTNCNANCRAMEHSEPPDILERADYRHALAALREPELPNAGERRRRGNGDDDEERVIFENDRPGVVRVKGTTANAQIRSLQRDFGDGYFGG